MNQINLSIRTWTAWLSILLAAAVFGQAAYSGGITDGEPIKTWALRSGLERISGYDGLRCAMDYLAPAIVDPGLPIPNGFQRKTPAHRTFLRLKGQDISLLKTVDGQEVALYARFEKRMLPEYQIGYIHHTDKYVEFVRYDKFAGSTMKIWDEENLANFSSYSYGFPRKLKALSLRSVPPGFSIPNVVRLSFEETMELKRVMDHNNAVHDAQTEMAQKFRENHDDKHVYGYGAKALIILWGDISDMKFYKMFVKELTLKGPMRDGKPTLAMRGITLVIKDENEPAKMRWIDIASPQLITPDSDGLNIAEPKMHIPALQIRGIRYTID